MSLSIPSSKGRERDQQTMEIEEMILPTEYTSIEEILQDNPPIGYDHGSYRDLEGGNPESRLSMFSTVNQANNINKHGNSELICEERSYQDTNTGSLDKYSRTRNLRKHDVSRKSRSHKYKKSSYHENIQLNNTIAAFTEVENMLKSKDKDVYTILRQALDRYFKDLKLKNDQFPPGSFVYSAKHLPSYLIHSIMEIFYQMDKNETGKVSIMDFKKCCKILHLDFSTEDRRSKYKQKRTSSLKEPTCRSDQIWTGGQQPYLDLFVIKNQQNLNIEEFSICLLEQWAIRFCKDLNNKDKNEKNRKAEVSHKSPILKRVFKKFNKKSHSIKKDTIQNKECTNENRKYTSDLKKCETKENENVIQEDSTHPMLDIQEDSTHPMLDIKVLNKLITDLGSHKPLIITRLHFKPSLTKNPRWNSTKTLNMDLKILT